ncbi:hypothetical protein ACQ4PT_030538 [Festuca glaucescens]
MDSSTTVARSFSASFLFAIVSILDGLSDQGLAFVLAPTSNLSLANGGQYLGLLNATNGTASDHILAIELDTIRNPEMSDINSNHVGINVNSLISQKAKPAGYYGDEDSTFRDLMLNSRKPMQVWVDYDGQARILNVTLAPVQAPKPKNPLLSEAIDLSTIVAETMYVGLSSSTGVVSTHHYVLGWSFCLDGPAPPLELSKLPTLPHVGPEPRSKILYISLPLAAVLLIASVLAVVFFLWHRRRFAEVVIHRDIKARNVLLDRQMNGRLGDFGLARLYDHGTDAQTTHVVGTMGYLAPELVRTGKATPSTDVFAFGVFLLEVACGRRPIGSDEHNNPVVLVDWVFEHHSNGSIIDAVDSRLMGKFNTEEVTLVLTLGLLCAHPLPNARPSIQKVMQYLDSDQSFPRLSPTYMSYSKMAQMQSEGFDSYIMPCTPRVKSIRSASGESWETVMFDGR